MKKRWILTLTLMALVAGFALLPGADATNFTPFAGAELETGTSLTVPMTPADNPFTSRYQDPFQECLDCYLGCLSFPVPTRWQCESWCYNTIPGCYL